MTLNAAYLLAQESLKPITDAWAVEARHLVCHFADCDALTLILEGERPLPATQESALRRGLERRTHRVPLQHILGTAHFYELSLEVTEDVLIPRPETECLVTFVLERMPEYFESGLGAPLSILDLGTGSGAIAIALAYSAKHPVALVGTDRSERALAVAARNASRSGVDSKINWLCGDWFQPLRGYHNFFDIIVSNPPYIPYADRAHLEPEVRDFDPEEALFAEDNGLAAYGHIIPEARRYLKHGGLLAFEAGHNQQQRVQALFRANGYADIGCFSDFNGIPRFIYGYWRGTTHV